MKKCINEFEHFMEIELLKLNYKNYANYNAYYFYSKKIVSKLNENYILYNYDTKESNVTDENKIVNFKIIFNDLINIVDDYIISNNNIFNGIENLSNKFIYIFNFRKKIFISNLDFNVILLLIIILLYIIYYILYIIYYII